MNETTPAERKLGFILVHKQSLSLLRLGDKAQSVEPLAKLFLKVSPGFTWGYSNSTPIGVVPGFTWVKVTGSWGYSFNNINPVGVERE